MKTPDQLTAVLLNKTVGLLFQIHRARGKCSYVARRVLAKAPADHAAVEHCAKLDEALAAAYRQLQLTVRGIQKSRARKKKKA